MVSWRTPNSYREAGLRRGTATSKFYETRDNLLRGFYWDFVGVARALESGSDPDPDDLDLLRGYLDDPGVPSWLLRRIVAARLPASEVVLAGALASPDFSWDRDRESLLASTPGDHEPTVTLAIVPSLRSK